MNDNYNVLNDEYIKKVLGPQAPYDFSNKIQCIWNEVDYMTLKCMKIFDIENLDSTVDKRNFLLWWMTSGVVCITDKPDGVLRVFFGGLGGEKDENYRSKTFLVNNPYLGKGGFSAELKIIWEEGQEGDCVVFRSDSLYKGLLPLHFKYATMKVENELSLKVADILARMPTLLKGDTEEAVHNADRLFENIEDGKLGTILDESILTGLKELQITNQTANLFHGLIEFEQFIDSKWLGSIGLNSNYNMKREAISDAEKAMNEDELLPLIDNMKEELERGCKLVNWKWDRNWIPKFDSSWEDNEKEIELEQKIMEAEADGESDTSDNGLDISTEDGDREPDGGEETDTDERDEEEREQEGDVESGETNDDNNSSSEGDNINIEVNINVNSDDNKEQEKEEVENEEAENS
jgi:hypothetical protein